MKSYAGIGSRLTPPPILLNMSSVAARLANRYILRTGGAKGADTAFIEGARHTNPTNIEIYLPQDGFNGYRIDGDLNTTDHIPDKAWEMAEKFHPKFHTLSDYPKKLMARNSLQVFGKDMDDPVDFIICYTTDGKASGGTGQALRIAEYYGIKVYNLYNLDDFKMVTALKLDYT